MSTDHRLPSETELVKFHTLIQGKVYQCLASRPHLCTDAHLFFCFTRGYHNISTWVSTSAKTATVHAANTDLILCKQWQVCDTKVVRSCMNLLTWAEAPFTHLLLIVHRVKPQESRCFWVLHMLRLHPH